MIFFVKMVINKYLDIKAMGTTKCLSLDRNGKNCVFHCINETTFCKFHQYMVSYSQAMLSQLELCKGCKKMYYFEDDVKTCEKCRDRGKSNKETAKESVVLCSKSGCKFKKSSENEYCGKHQLCLFEDETKSLGKKTCYNIIRGCRSQLDVNCKFSKCEECLEKDRKKDKDRRKKSVSENNEVVHDRTTKFCTTCIKEFPICQFVGEKSGETKTCLDCRTNNKIQDAKRDKERRNELARKNNDKPERKEVKKEWAENNYEKVALKTMNYRHRKMEENQEGYLANNAEQAKKWRENHPEKMLESNENKKNSKELQYNVYGRNANLKNLEFTISFEDYSNVVTKECHYCGVIQEKGFNGMDRKDQSVGYIIDNCVSCCKMCNYMKGSTCEEVFIKRVEHILTFQGKIQGNLYPECFANHKSGRYSDYRRRALKKQLDFVITPDDYNSIIKKDCYLCGKKNEDSHKNGIDRIDNNVGYISSNVKPCCCECNYIKKDYETSDLFEKFNLIYENHKNDYIEETIENGVIDIEDNEDTNDITKDFSDKNRTKQRLHRERMIEKHGIDFVREKQKEKMARLRENNKNIGKNKNKQTDEEKKEKARLRKQKQRENMKEKYGDEEYKKIRAKEIAENRKKNASIQMMDM